SESEETEQKTTLEEMTEQKSDVEETVEEEQKSIAGDNIPDTGDNALLSALLGSKAGEMDAPTVQEAEQNNDVVEGGPLAKPYTVGGQEYLVPKFDPNSEEIDMVIRKARKGDGSMITPEEREALKNHLLTLSQHDESENANELFGSPNQEDTALIELDTEKPLVKFFKRISDNIYYYLKGYSKIITFIKSGATVTFLIARAKKSGFTIIKVGAYELPLRTEQGLIEELPQLIHYIF
ncbi:uncharacterized protein METZ01_LOCUS494613, partial [marine metagenome]